MKVYGDLEVQLIGTSLDELTSKLDAVGSTLWTRNREPEGLVNRSGGQDGRCYLYSGPDLPSANLWLFPRDDSAYVSNIVPAKSGQLSTDEYNGILTSFHDELLGPVATQLGVQPRLSKTGEVTPEDFISGEAAERLRRFSASANKSTGSSHPLDKQRWNDFVIACHRNRDRLPTDVFEMWLAEDGWDDETTSDLAIEFELGRGLLERYDGTE